MITASDVHAGKVLIVDNFKANVPLLSAPYVAQVMFPSLRRAIPRRSANYTATTATT